MRSITVLFYLTEFVLYLVDNSVADIEQEIIEIVNVEEDALLTVPEIIKKYGYPIETHYVTTSDGYILEMHRIPYGQSANVSSKRVAFLQHGLLSSSSCYVITGVNNGLAYILADAGYDVWMGNARGNIYSRNHTTLDPNNSEEFWDFSWHEIGIYDIPSMIDFTLNKTGQDKLFYIGHSQGTTAFFVMTSMRPEYNQKIIAAFCMAPIAFMNNLKSPVLQMIATWQGPISALFDFLGIDEFLPGSEFYAIAGELVCDKDSMIEALCTQPQFLLAGYSIKELNETIVPIIVGHTPAGASTNQIVHYGQEVLSGRFRQFERGIIGNLLEYGTFCTPDYNLSAITVSIYLFYSENDWMSSEIDVKRLDDKLQNSRMILVEDKEFNHLDYVFGIHAPKYVYSKIDSIMRSISYH